jgi:hypothetical protein
MAIHDAPEPVGWPSFPPFGLIAPSLRNVCGGRCAAEFGQHPSLISRRRVTQKLPSLPPPPEPPPPPSNEGGDAVLSGTLLGGSYLGITGSGVGVLRHP